MPLTETLVKKAKPDQRPPVRHKGVRSKGSDKSAGQLQSDKKQDDEKNAQHEEESKTDPGKKPKSYKLYDGENLYIEVFRNGSKIWRFRFKFSKENVISLGKYPTVSLAQAREERDKCLELLAKGINPSLHKKLAKKRKTGESEDSFEIIAREWLKKFIDSKAEKHRKRVYARFENDVFPWIGKRPIHEITSQEVFAVI